MKDQISVRSAARELDTSRRTINRAIDERKELYGLLNLEPEGGETTNNNDIQNLEQRIVEVENKNRRVSHLTVVELVQNDESSKRKAARQLDTSRRTINRGLDRRELYSL